MAVNNNVQDTLNSIGAIQTLVEKFPMNFFSFGDFNLACSFDVIAILFKILGIDKEEVTQKFTDLLCGNIKDRSDGSGFISYAEEIVKMALETNIINILNCTTNPIIHNKLLDRYKNSFNNYISGEGITVNVAEIDLMGFLEKNPFTTVGKNFYFDLEDENGTPYTPIDIYKSKDFNAFLWWLINKSSGNNNDGDKCVWDNRYRAKIYPDKDVKKNIIRCKYTDDAYPNSDSITIQLCNETYYKTRKLSSKYDLSVNKTIFEFNHDFLSSIKLYEPKVIVAEMVQYLMGGTAALNFGISLNEQVIQEKIDSMIEKVITSNDTEINDCFFSFSNEEYNNMLNIAQKKRFEVNNSSNYTEDDVNSLYQQLSTITNDSTLENDKSVITNVINSVGDVRVAQDAETELNLSLNYDWRFELMRAILNPFVRPLFSPKVLFLLAVNKKIMGSIEDVKDWDWEDAFSELLNGIFFIIKDIIIKLQDMIIDILLELIMDKLRPLLELFASRLLLETMKMYKDLLMQLLNECLYGFKIKGDSSGIDNVNYADIEQVEPEQTNC